jgi:hypothetical protein
MIYKIPIHVILMQIRTALAFGILLFLVGALSVQAQECSEYWVCTDWSFCMHSGMQARTCVDASRCGTEREKPNETQECVPVPIRDIVVPEPQDTGGITAAIISSTPTLLGIVALALGVAAYVLYRKWKDLRMFVSAP